MASAAWGVGGRNESLGVQYWTEERRAEAERRTGAKPFPMAEAGGGERPAMTGEALPTGPSGHSPGHDPHSHADAKAAAAHLEAPSAGGATVDVQRPLVYPWTAIGKLYYTQNGKPDTGSGALISPNIVLTAGHCLYDRNNGGISKGVCFYPSYGVGAQGRDQHDPYYKFDCSYLAWPPMWGEDRDPAYDYGLAWIDAAPGNTLGWLGYAYNQPMNELTNMTWTAYGYPADSPSALTSGNTMKAVVGRYAPSPFPGMIGMTNNDMGHGASGGPWVTTDPVVISADYMASYHVIGVNSTIHAPPPIMSSPYFTPELGRLFAWISDRWNREPPPFPPPPRH